MDEEEGTLAHRVARVVDVCGGEFKVKVRPWVMSQRAELKPKLAKLLERVQAGSGDLSLASVIVEAEEEIVEIAKATAEMPEGLTWDELLWEDLPSIAQAIWETSVVTLGGGGIAGKALALLAGIQFSVAARAEVAKAESERANDSQPPKIAAVPNSQGSPS